MAPLAIKRYPTSQNFFSQRLRLHYVDYGSPEKPLMVLVHGSRDHCRAWDLVAGELAEHYHVIAPDLRGHGDSAWAIGSQYSMAEYVLDLAQLLRHVGEERMTLLGHSLGGAVVLRYAGLFPDTVVSVAAIEGLGPPPGVDSAEPAEQRLRNWIAAMQGLASRTPHRYRSISKALERMQDANPNLSPELAEHLTVHGVMRMEDGTYTWKFDNYVRTFAPHAYDREGTQELWARIECPVFLARGKDSWAENPVDDGRTSHFKDYTYREFDNAGHWLHHDQFEPFVTELKAFLEID